MSSEKGHPFVALTKESNKWAADALLRAESTLLDIYMLLAAAFINYASRALCSSSVLLAVICYRSSSA